MEPQRYHHGPLGRYRQVVRILARHGFGWLLAQLGIGGRTPLPWGLFGKLQTPPLPTQAEQLRQAIEELGVTYIKLGQILSTRSDLLPAEYITELSRLQDAVPPEPLEVIKAQVERELGAPPDEVFDRFDPEPVGSASIGQVHGARLKSGEEVVVKVQRPGVDALVEEDLAILMDLARLAAGRTVWGQVYDLPSLVDEFATTLRGEMDYIQEGQYADRFRRNFRGNPNLRVPTIFWDVTTRRVLAMERLEGIKISDLPALEAAGIDRSELAERSANLVLKMILEDGFFHADPHPGNFLVMADGSIGLLDYGIVGQIDEKTRQGLLYLLIGITARDLDRVVDQLTALGMVGNPLQLERLRRDLGHLLSLYWGLPLKEIDMTQILEESMAIARRHRLQIPTSLAILIKTAAMDEGLARSLDPDFSAAEVVKPYIWRLAWERYLPQNWLRRLGPSLLDMNQLVVDLPRRAERLLTGLEHGSISINMHVQDTEHVLDVLGSLVNRLILGMLVSSFAVAIALLLQIYYTVGFRWLVGWLLVIGLVFVSGLGLWLAIRILRRGHH
jgi:ubiquinone biosynthesis protein